MPLPDKPQTREAMSPLGARVLLASPPKIGKTTLLSQWAPKTTLIVDTHNGTKLLEGEHFVQHVYDWSSFVGVVDDLVKRDSHEFKTVGLDLIDDLWTFCDKAYAGRGNELASSTDDYSRSIKNAEGAFRNQIGRLLGTTMGIWFLAHTIEVEDDKKMRHKSKLDKRVDTYVRGACDFVLLAERFGPKRQLHTQPSEKFEAGARIVLPNPLDLDARKLYAAMDSGLNPAPAKKAAAKKAAAKPAAEAVAA